MSKKIIIYSDGGSRGNPGPAGVGVVFYNEDGEIIDRRKEYIGEQTNNQAEYQALILGLTEGVRMEAGEIHCHLDSELVVKQMKGQYKVKNPNIIELYRIAKALAEKVGKVTFTHVPREKNVEADGLANEAMDSAKKYS